MINHIRNKFQRFLDIFLFYFFLFRSFNDCCNKFCKKFDWFFIWLFIIILFDSFFDRVDNKMLNSYDWIDDVWLKNEKMNCEKRKDVLWIDIRNVIRWSVNCEKARRRFATVDKNIVVFIHIIDAREWCNEIRKEMIFEYFDVICDRFCKRLRYIWLWKWYCWFIWFE